MSTALDIQDAGPLKLPLSEIRIDPELQCRANGVSKAVVREYAEAMREHGPDRFASVVVFKDSKAVHWLADGFTRCAALASIDETASIKVEIHEGSRRDALLYAAGANAEHGRARSPSDKRAAVAKLLSDPTWSKRSDAWLASQAKVSAPFVAKMKATLNVLGGDLRETADGRTMNVGGMARAADTDATIATKLTAQIERAVGQWPDSEHPALRSLLARLTEAMSATEAAE